MRIRPMQPDDWERVRAIYAQGIATDVRAHERAGFRLVGRRERLGKLAGQWRDVLLLERRSSRVGND